MQDFAATAINSRKCINVQSLFLNEGCGVYEINGNIFIKFPGFTASENNPLFLKALQNPHEETHRKGQVQVSILDGFSMWGLGKLILMSQFGYFIIWSSFRWQKTVFVLYTGQYLPYLCGKKVSAWMQWYAESFTCQQWNPLILRFICLFIYYF